MLPLKSLFLPGTILLLILPIYAQSAEVYRTKDADGNVVFSDQPSDEAEVVKLGKTMSYTPAPELQTLASPEVPDEVEKGPQYTEFTITSPQGEEAIRSNNGDLRVAFTLKPTLQNNHSIELLMDGTSKHTSKSATAIELPNVDRGTHSIQMQVVDDNSGEVIFSSDSVNVSMIRTIQRPRATPH
ncbi:MAG: DUF4124 domain-containing protein [bacterium]|nr:DUF4124 domain-containing protein [Gammaproteobacteria bacterium]HIL94565.1 DUF4124 domain-containing protein [Pseudomonadales bacterium]